MTSDVASGLAKVVPMFGAVVLPTVDVKVIVPEHTLPLAAGHDNDRILNLQMETAPAAEAGQLAL